MFDRFEPGLVNRMLKCAGVPAGVVDQIKYAYSNLRRYIRVVGAYGATINQTNGVGQGCSMRFTIANLFLATLLIVLRHEHLGIELGAFFVLLDDF